jgi:Ca2+-binding EF-hand superfamily protein
MGHNRKDWRNHMTRFDYRRLALAALALGVMVPAAAHAEEAGKADHKPMGMFREADTDKDGFLTRAELDAAHKKRLDEMFANTDTNKDGKLSQDEMKEGRKKMREKWKERRAQMKSMREEMKKGKMEDDAPMGDDSH